MKNGLLSVIGAVTLSFISAQLANADVTGINLRFGGGCLTSNTTGSYVLKPRFSGFDLQEETAVLYMCA